MNLTVALTGAALVVCIAIFASCLTRVLGFGMMDENETAAGQNNSPEAIFTQNQLNCLNLDDGWWSPIAGPDVVKVCKTNTGDNSKLQALSKQTETSKSSQSATESNTETQPTTATSTPPTDVTETKDKEGNTVLSSTIQDLTITAITATQSIKEIIGTPEVAQQVAAEDKKDYNRGLVEGIKYAFKIGEKIGKRSNEITEQQSKYNPEQLNEERSSAILDFTSEVTKNKTDAYKLGLSRGLTLGADFVDTTGISGVPHKQQIK